MFYLKVIKNKSFENGQESPLQREDFIIDVDGVRFSSFAEFQKLAESCVASIRLGVLRNGIRLEFQVQSSVGLGGVLVEVHDDNSYEELVRVSTIRGMEEQAANLLQIERNRVDDETPKRVIHVVVYYAILGAVVYLFNTNVITLPGGHYRGLGYLMILAFLFPILYLVLGKKVFK